MSAAALIHAVGQAGRVPRKKVWGDVIVVVSVDVSIAVDFICEAVVCCLSGRVVEAAGGIVGSCDLRGGGDNDHLGVYIAVYHVDVWRIDDADVLEPTCSYV